MTLTDDFSICSDNSLVKCLFHKQCVLSSIPTVTNKLIFSSSSYAIRHNLQGSACHPIRTQSKTYLAEDWLVTILSWLNEIMSI
jgi:hypothetical protein